MKAEGIPKSGFAQIKNILRVTTDDQKRWLVGPQKIPMGDFKNFTGCIKALCRDGCNGKSQALRTLNKYARLGSSPSECANAVLKKLKLRKPMRPPKHAGTIYHHSCGSDSSSVFA